jgi:glycosyltransferase involved in cell wall biosynthesis
MSLIIGIDASRNHSGGAKAHIIGILSEYDPSISGIKEVHIWSFKSLLDQLPDFPWLIKHNPLELEQSLYKQLIWQAISFSRELKEAGCNILFNSSAITLCRFEPSVALSQNLITYEPGIVKSYGYSLIRFRLLAIHILQNLSFCRANGVIFLTHYAGKVVQKSCGLLNNVRYIPHGINNGFKNVESIIDWPDQKKRPIRCIYVSYADMYKNQWVVVRALSLLRSRGFNITLELVGGGYGVAQDLLNKAIHETQTDTNFVKQIDFLVHEELPNLLAQKDLFIFASSCENLPITLIEGMAVGLPIACSNRGPMPEVLQDGGVYFDPENDKSIADCIEKIILSEDLRMAISSSARKLSERYNWKKCANETFQFIAETYLKSNK